MNLRERLELAATLGDDVTLLDKGEVAELLGVSPHTVVREISEGNLRVSRVRGQNRFTLSEIRRYLSEDRPSLRGGDQKRHERERSATARMGDDFTIPETFEQFVSVVARLTRGRDKGLRAGQVAFNVLDSVRPDISGVIRGEPDDPTTISSLPSMSRCHGSGPRSDHGGRIYDSNEGAGLVNRSVITMDPHMAATRVVAELLWNIDVVGRLDAMAEDALSLDMLFEFGPVDLAAPALIDGYRLWIPAEGREVLVPADQVNWLYSGDSVALRVRDVVPQELVDVQHVDYRAGGALDGFHGELVFSVLQRGRRWAWEVSWWQRGEAGTSRTKAGALRELNKVLSRFGAAVPSRRPRRRRRRR